MGSAHRSRWNGPYHSSGLRVHDDRGSNVMWRYNCQDLSGRRVHDDCGTRCEGRELTDVWHFPRSKFATTGRQAARP